MRLLFGFLLAACIANPVSANDLSPQATACSYLIKAMSRTPNAITIGEIIDYAKLDRTIIDIHISATRDGRSDLEEIIECEFSAPDSLMLSAYRFGGTDMNSAFVEKANDALVLAGYRP